MADYKTPGVYIEEISTLPASVAAVATAIPAFVGHTDIAHKDGDDEALRGVPTRITSMLDYEKYFGMPNPEDLVIKVTDTYDGVDSQPAVFVERKITADPPSTVSEYKMYYSLQLYFNNGGGPCYIVSVADFDTAVSAGDAATANTLVWGLSKLEKYDEPTLLVFPDQMTVAAYKGVYDEALAHCEKLKDRFVIMDLKQDTDDPLADAKEFRDNGIGISNLKYGAAYYPYLKSTLNYGYDESDDSGALTVDHTINYIGTGTPTDLPADTTPKLYDISQSDPSLYRSVKAEIAKLYVDLPPSGAVAGIYARVDRQRGSGKPRPMWMCVRLSGLRKR